MRLIVSCFAVLLVSGPVYGQAQESRAAVSAIGGFGKTFDDESSLGRGWLVGGAYEHVLFGNTRAEASLEVLTHDRSTGFFLSEGRTVMGNASLIQRFGSGKAQPYVLAGLTAGYHSGTNRFDDRAVNLSNSNLGFRVGGGVAIPAGERLEVRPEFRLHRFFIDNDSDPATMFSFGIRVAWRL